LAAPEVFGREAFLAAVPFLTGPLVRAVALFFAGPLVRAVALFFAGPVVRAAALFFTGPRLPPEPGPDPLGVEAFFRFAKRSSLPYRQTFGSR
jgi:hypothetical protein